MPQPTTTDALTVDRIACDGYGLCAELLPELIELDDWGYPILSTEPVPPQLVERARRAVARCPALALRLRAVPSAAGTDAAGRRSGVPARAMTTTPRLEP